MTSANNPYVNPKSDERLVMQVKALPPEAAKSVLIRLAQGLPSDTVGRALSSALAMHAVMPPTAAPAEPAGPLGKDKGWAEMSDGEKKAAGALGYDEASWEEGLVPEACTKRWETLEGTVKAAAVSLGYTQEEWDAELEPAADEWAISECSEYVAVGGIGLLFTLCFLRRRRRVAQPQRAVETAADGSIYSALDGSDAHEEATGLLEAEAEARGQQATIQALAAQRDAEAVGKLRRLADEDIFARCETRPLRLLAASR